MTVVLDVQTEVAETRKSRLPSNQNSGLIAINPEAVFEQMESLDLDNVRARVIKDELIPKDKVETAISEYRKFLCLFGLGYKNLAMCSLEVDEIWHTHILFTREYTEFTNRVLGGYLHHKPNLESDPIMPGGDIRFYDAYTQVFGDLHPIWNFTSNAGCITDPPMCRACQGCGQCGDNPDPPDDD